MNRHLLRSLLTAALFCLFSAPGQVFAQGLVWSLPEDGTWVRYEGTYRNKEFKAGATDGPLEIEFRSELTIKSVGRAELPNTVTVSKTVTVLENGREKKVIVEEQQSQTFSARWLEFKSVVGRESAEGTQSGPFGTRIYKVLILESAIIGKPVDATGIPVRFIPIIEGYRKIGQGAVEKVKERVLAVHPSLSLVTFYPDLAASGEAAPLALATGNVSAQLFKGTSVTNSSDITNSNTAELWLASDVPFGMAKFVVTAKQSEKVVKASAKVADGKAAAAVVEYVPVSEIVSEMVVVETGKDARSEIAEGSSGTAAPRAVATPVKRPDVTPAAKPAAEEPVADEPEPQESVEEEPVAEEASSTDEATSDETTGSDKPTLEAAGR